jgi:uncharacterized protein
MDAIDSLYPRTISEAIREALADTPVVSLLGPRQSGKTTLVQTMARERRYVSLDEPNLFQAATMDPTGFVGSLPESVTIDEIQRVPSLLPAIKRSVDLDRRPGRFLLTGSANLLLLPRVSESLAGRMEIIRLQPLTESEKQRVPGAFLSDFLAGNVKPTMSQSDSSDAALLDRLFEGGYPEPSRRPANRARQWHRNYLASIIERDIKDIADIRQSSEVARLLELLSERTATLLNVSRLAQNLGLNRTTLDHYLQLLERLFLVRRLPAWHHRAAKRLVKTPKIHIVDSGLAATLSGLQASDWLEQRTAVGHLLESFVVQQVVAQGSWTDPDLRFWHYRDKDKVEVDLVVSRSRSLWGIEVKSAASVSPRDTLGLRRLAAHAGDQFSGGIVFYTGNHVLPLGDSRFLAVPLRELWSR